MKVRKSAWHHWFYGFGFEHCQWQPETTNLCSYFWRTVWGVLKTLIIIAVAGAILTVAGMCFYSAPWFSIGCVAAVGVVIAVASNWSTIKYRLNPGRYDSESAPEPGLLRSYIKAKKDKVCPLIEFVE
jgi:hypothetical protein